MTFLLWVPSLWLIHFSGFGLLRVKKRGILFIFYQLIFSFQIGSIFCLFFNLTTNLPAAAAAPHPPWESSSGLEPHPSLLLLTFPLNMADDNVGLLDQLEYY